MSIRLFAVSLALVASLALAACGSDEQTASEAADTTGQAEAEVTPAQARAEIGQVRSALDRALGAVEEGDAKAAEDAVSEGYLQHFEKVEGPLGKVDEELKEKLEHAIREDLRDTIRKGGSVASVTKMISDIGADLDAAEQKLR